jgi:hypothetical protein
MQPQALHEELVFRGLQLLGVSQHQANPEVLVIYLHGNAGDWVDKAALDIVSSVPGVRNAVESVSTPTIILAWVSDAAVSDVPIQQEHTDD